MLLVIQTPTLQHVDHILYEDFHVVISKLTLIDSITQITLPFLAIYEEYEWIDVGAAHSAPDYRCATDYRQVL